MVQARERIGKTKISVEGAAFLRNSDQVEDFDFMLDRVDDLKAVFSYWTAKW